MTMTAVDPLSTRPMRWITMLTAVIAIAPAGIVAVVLTSESPWEAVILGFGFVATFPVLTQWNIDVYPRRSLFAVTFAGIIWLVCAVPQSSALGFFALALVGAILLVRLPRRRLAATCAFASGVALLGATSLLTAPPTWEVVDRYIFLPFGGTLFIVGIVILSEQSWLLVRRLERAKETEAELSIARERMRFAGDLHDIQGHTLHVIKLKIALARRLVRVDPDRADDELDEARRLIADTIEETRELAYARHELNLSAELENARRLCEATGIDVEVRASADLSGPAHVLLAHVLREATSNLLRHAKPTAVSITATSTRVEIINDGAPDSSDSELRGLARLRERVELAGGELWIARTPGRFAVSAVIAVTAARGTTTLRPCLIPPRRF